MRYMNVVLPLLATALLSDAAPAADPPAKIANPFYAMDTAFQRPGLTQGQQLDLVRESVLRASPGKSTRRKRPGPSPKRARNAG